MQSEIVRIEAFSDGVFAIAIMLLILEIKNVNKCASYRSINHSGIDHQNKALSQYSDFYRANCLFLLG